MYKVNGFQLVVIHGVKRINDYLAAGNIKDEAHATWYVH
jgi:hypothetical protein